MSKACPFCDASMTDAAHWCPKHEMDRPGFEADVLVELLFKAHDEGGRQGDIIIGATGFYGMIVALPAGNFDSRIWLKEYRLALGRTYTVPLKFLSPQLVLPLMPVGTRFHSAHEGAVGKVLEIGSRTP